MTKPGHWSTAKGINDQLRSYNLSLKLIRCQSESGLVVNYPRVQKIIFPDHNIPGDSQTSVSFVSPGREPGEYAKIRETHG